MGRFGSQHTGGRSKLWGSKFQPHPPGLCFKFRLNVSFGFVFIVNSSCCLLNTCSRAAGRLLHVLRQTRASRALLCVSCCARRLAQGVRAHLVSVFGKRTVDSLLTTVANAGTVMSEAAARGLNGMGGWVEPVTPEGLIFVARWALLAVIGYWLLSLLVSLLVGVFRKVLFFLKLVLAIAGAFWWIVSDVNASAETTAMRLRGLMLVCVLLGIGLLAYGRGGSVHLERRVKALEKRLGEMEKNKKDECRTRNQL